MEFIEPLEAKIKEARELAKTSPGTYGGRYVAARFDKKTKQDVFFVMNDDDPSEAYKQLGPSDCIYAHVTPTKVFGIGRCRNYINEDGTVDREYFKH